MAPAAQDQAALVSLDARSFDSYRQPEASSGVMVATDGIRTVVCVLGTRPEAVKMAPVIQALRASPWCRAVVVSTGQHRELLAQTLGFFGIRPDHDLDLMAPDQTLAGLTAGLLSRLDPLLVAHAPALVLAQGDTTTVMATALACFYRRIPFGHVEAGLRTGDLQSPFPEEFNRLTATRLAALHFAPTAGARANLLAEGVAPGLIHLTGNTVIDALRATAARPGLASPFPRDPARRLVLLTAHRRENLGPPLARICAAARALLARFPDVELVYPMHPNPAVRRTVEPMLGGLDRAHLVEPVDYLTLTALLARCTLVLTDSGGLQEEAPALGKPVLVLRDKTERPEAIEAGVAVLVGTETASILAAATRLLSDPAAHAAMAGGASPFGDGQAGPRIAALCGAFLSIKAPSLSGRAAEWAPRPVARSQAAGRPRPASEGTTKRYGQPVSGGSDIRIASTFPPVFRPKIVPRS